MLEERACEHFDYKVSQMSFLFLSFLLFLSSVLWVRMASGSGGIIAISVSSGDGGGGTFSVAAGDFSGGAGGAASIIA